MRAIATAIPDRFREWWGQFQSWRARLHEQRHQPASYSLISMQRTTAFAKWLAGLSGAGMVLAFGFYVQSYLSILSIKNDCVSLRFVADANLGAARYALWFLMPGALALLAIVWPTAIGILRNLQRWMKAHKLPPLQPGHEFDSWSELQVTKWVTSLQLAMVCVSAVLFVGLTYNFLSFAIGSKPERVLKEWHDFELQCLPQPPDDQGMS